MEGDERAEDVRSQTLQQFPCVAHRPLISNAKGRADGGAVPQTLRAMRRSPRLPPPGIPTAALRPQNVLYAADACRCTETGDMRGRSLGTARGSGSLYGMPPMAENSSKRFGAPTKFMLRLRLFPEDIPPSVRRAFAPRIVKASDGIQRMLKDLKF